MSTAVRTAQPQRIGQVRSRTTFGRPEVVLGRGPDDRPVLWPSGSAAVLITGDSGAGKSHLLGLVAERLLAARGTVVVIDPEGDHVGLGELDDVVVLDGARQLSPKVVIDLVRERFSVVVDLTVLPEQERRSRAASISRSVRRCRQWTGQPTWILVDEAHTIAEDFLTGLWRDGGYVLATYRPESLPGALSANLTHRIEVTAPYAARLTRTGGSWSDFTPAARTTIQVRHRHKYTDGLLAYDRGFHFRDDRGRTGPVARNVPQFLDQVAAGTDDELLHHCSGHDLSRWFRDVHRDDQVADVIESLERSATGADRQLGLEDVRRGIIDGVRRRYC